MSPIPAARLSIWMSASAALFFLLALSAPNGYSWGGGLLLLGGLATAWSRRGRWHTSSTDGHRAMPRSCAPWTIQDRTLLLLLLAVFLINALAVVWHGDSGKYLDQGVRYLLAIPILWGLRRVQLRLDWLWIGLVLGCLGTAAVAWWQVHILAYDRAEGFVTSAIPFGDMALMMTFWCVLGAALSAIQRRRGWAAFLLIGALAGAYAFIAAATRGGLVAVPVLMVLAGWALIRREHARQVLAGAALLVVAITLVVTLLPAGQVTERRVDEAFSEWHAYSQHADATNNVGARLEAWKAALISIPDRPLLGWEHADYQAQLQTLIQAGQVDPFVETLSNTHNQFIEIWLHQGTLGLMAFLALLIASFWYFAQRLRHADATVRILACCGASLPAGFAAFGLTQVILGRNNGVMFFLVSLAVWWAMMRQAEGKTD
ncbi:O-antigen ligase family protein [Castellaniella sp.]|uniref:O-antigen ligase family protein n=1 Tax=Castellaniella sp. TaxID=1955812 RepID=UPI002B0039EC|nr:O-antigen ligase family protein [Castellaniella sp.]